MSLFTKSILFGLIASIVMTGLARLISIYYLKKKKFRESYGDFYNVLGKVQMIRINFIKNYKYMN